MLQNRHIAAFIDVNNMALETDHYENVLNQLNEWGEIVSATLYNVTDKKHKKIIADAESRGYTIQRAPQGKRFVKKSFDNRIFVDVVDAINLARVIDTVCIVAAPADMLYLYSYLRNRGIKIAACDNTDENSLALVSEVVDLGKVLEIKPQVKKTVGKPYAPETKQVVPEDVKQELDRTDELLKEINRLRADAETPAPDIMDETKRLQQTIDRLTAEKEQEEAQSDQPTTLPLTDESYPVADVEPATEQAEQPEVEQSAPAEAPQDDSDLIRKINELRQNNESDNSDELLDEIKKLIDITVN